MLKISDYDKYGELIRTFDSERYGDHVDFKENLNMSYVDKYEVITGNERILIITKMIIARTNREKEYMIKSLVNAMRELNSIKSSMSILNDDIIKKIIRGHLSDDDIKLMKKIIRIYE